MRTRRTTRHEPCENVWREIVHCGIVFLLRHDEDVDPDDERYIGPDEFGVANDHCTDDPVILTRAELRRLGEHLIAMADGKGV